MSSIAGLPITSVGEGSSYMNGMIWGIPGSGKTTLAGSAYEVEELHPILFVDIEGGTKAIEEKYPKMDRVRVKTEHDSKGRVIKSAWNQCKDIYESLKRGEGGYTTVIVDNLSEAYQLCMRDTMEAFYAEKPETTDVDVPSLRAYGKAGSQVRWWVRHLRDLDCHVIFTAHEMAQTNDEGRALAYTPSFPGKLPYELAGFMDMVLYLYVKQDRDETNRKLQTGIAGKYLAKDRSGKLPLVLSDPTMAKVYGYYTGGIEE